ncbi:MAG: bacterial transcriptional activator domain-containing protein [bacterium]|nr:bacterial transcriptional activator domain-containing protein [bacterium]
MVNKALFLLLCCWSFWGSLPVYALEVEILWDRKPEYLDLTLKWSEPSEPSVSYDRQNNELLIRFPEGISMPGLPSAEPIMQGWAEVISLSFDALFIKLHPDLKAQVSPSAQQLTIRLENPYAGRVPLDQNTLAYRLVQTRLWMRQGRVLESMHRLEELRKNNPKSVSVLTSLVEAHLLLGNWAKALEMAEAAIDEDPLNEGLWDLRREILQQRGNEITLTARRRWSDGLFTENIREASLNLRFFEYLYLGVQTEENRYNLQQLRPIAPLVPAAAQGSQRRNTIYLGMDLPFNVSLKGAQQTQEELTGQQVSLYLYDLLGETRLISEQTLPYWGIQEGLLGNSSRSQTRLERVLRLGPSFEMMLALSARDYALIGDNLASSSAVDGYARYSWRNPRGLVEAVQSNARLEFEIDWVQETAHSVQVQLDSFAKAFDQKSVMLKGLISVSWLDELTTQAYLGYGINLLATNAPLAGFDIFTIPFKRGELNLGYNRYIDRQITSEAYLTARWKF